MKPTINSMEIRRHLPFSAIRTRHKFEKTRIHFKSDVFTSIAVVDAKAHRIECPFFLNRYNTGLKIKAILKFKIALTLYDEAETFLYQVSRTSVDTDVSSVAFCLQKIYYSKAFV